MLATRQRLLNHPKQSPSDVLKTISKRGIEKSTEGSGDLISNKIADRITKVLKTSKQSYSESVANEHDKKI